MNADTPWPPTAHATRRPTLADLFAASGGSLPSAVTASAMVAMGFGLAVALIVVAQGLAAPLAGWLGLRAPVGEPPAALAAIGGLILGTALAAQVLHRQHASPLGHADGDARYAYTAAGRRRMAAGLVAAYLTAATLVVVVVSATGASVDLARLLAY